MTWSEANDRIRLCSRRNIATGRTEWRVVFIDETGAIRVRSGAIQSYVIAKKLRDEWIALRRPAPGTVERKAG